MKKFLSIVLAVALMLTCVSLVACNKDDNDVDPVVGVYTLTSATNDGEPVPMPEDVSYLIEIKADNTVVMTETDGTDSDVETGTWAKDGSNITLSFGEGESAYSVTLAISENALTYTEDGFVQVFTKNQ